MSRERRSRRGSASDASQQEGEPADELGGESATALLLSKLAEVTGQLAELQSERAADRARLEEVGAAAAASMVWSPPVAEHAEAAFCGARAAWATP